MPETPIETLVPEEDFADLLRERGAAFFRVCAAPAGAAWTKRRFFDLSVAADEVESLLDDYGARTNRTYSGLTEVVASIRGFALAGISLAHLVRRLDSYRLLDRLEDGGAEARSDLAAALEFVQTTEQRLMGALIDEGRRLGVTELSPGEGEAPDDRMLRRLRLPFDVDLEAIEDEEQRIAVVATRYLEAFEGLEAARIRRIDDAGERERYLAATCTEEDARLWESKVHNLQSSYDTHVKNTLLETGDERLPVLRGHISATLHALEVVTLLTHFAERRDRGLRSEVAESLVQSIVTRADVREVTLNRLLVTAYRFLAAGVDLASALLPHYTNASEATLELSDGIALHARPASLIVAIVQRYGTPVELEVEGQSCNAGSILELMVAVGSNPEARVFIVRGDERPLRDLVTLFAADLGEKGLETLPDSISYLRTKAGRR